MSGINSNYTTALYGFQSGGEGGPQGYQAAISGPFNQLGQLGFGGGFAAYSIFWIDAGIQAPGAAVPLSSQFIWGNLDAVGGGGWAIGLQEDGADQLAIVGIVTAASGVRIAAKTISIAAGAAWVERLMCVSLWYTGSNIALMINGSMAAVDTHAADAYVPSALPAALGVGTDGDNPATNVRIVSAGYAPAATVDGTIGRLAGAHWKSCREAFAAGYLSESLGIDWSHRYDAAAASVGVTGAVTKSSKGVVSASAPVAPTTLADVGNLGPVTLPGVTTPAVLNRLGAVDLHVDQVANIDWYQGGAFEFTTLP